MLVFKGKKKYIHCWFSKGKKVIMFIRFVNKMIMFTKESIPRIETVRQK